MRRARTFAGVAACAASTALSGAPHDRQAATSLPAGDVSGVVIDGSTNQAVAGAVVSISVAGSRPTEFLRQQTDALGRFVFRDVPADAPCVLNATKPGYFPSEVGYPGTGDGLSRAPGGKRRFTLSAGQWIKDARVVLWRPAAITGTVVDEHGERVPGAYVRALYRASIAGRSLLAAGPVALTDDRGAYRLANLPAGAYVVLLPSVQTSRPWSTAMAAAASRGRPASRTEAEVVLRQAPDRSAVLVESGYPAAASLPDAARVYAPTYYPGVRGATEATLITLDYGQVRDSVDFHLEPLAARRVSGRVEPAGEDARGMLLRLIPFGSEGLGSGGEAAVTTVSDAGRFTFLNVATGRYTLEAAPGRGEFSIVSNLWTFTAPGRARLPRTAGVAITRVAGAGRFLSFARDMSDAAVYWARAEVEVSDRDIDDLTVELHEGSTIRGILQLDRDAQPPAHPYAALTLEPSITNPVLVSPPIEVAGGEDPADAWQNPRSFEIGGLTPGQYYLTTGAGTAIRSIAWGGRDNTREPLQVWPGQDTSDVVVTVTTNVASVTGVVRDRSSLTIAEAAVVYFPTDAREWEHLGFRPRRLGAVAADAGGVFRIADLPAGEYYVVALPLGHATAWRDPTFLAAVAPRATRVEVAWGEAKVQDLRLQGVGPR